MHSPDLMNLLIAPPLWLALLLSLLFAGLAWGMGLLTRGGALATFVVGFVVFGLGGGKFTVPLLTFFLSSSLLSKLNPKRKAQASRGDDKSSTRDAGQVWANGGAAVALTLAFAWYAHHWPIYKTRYLLLLFLAALATVNADTWATEVGKLSRNAPRLLSNWQPVAAGTSGAITGLGLLAAFTGAFVIPLSAFSLWGLDAAEFLTVVWAGFVGCFIDSLLGASLQAIYRDPLTGELTERAETVGRPNLRMRGLPWINNDLVNFLASVGGVLCAWLLLTYCVYPFQ